MTVGLLYSGYELLSRLWDPLNRFLEFWFQFSLTDFPQTHWMHSATWRRRRRCYLTVLFSSPHGARGHFSSRRRENFLPTSEEGTGGEIDACCGRPDASDDWPQKVSGVQDLFISGQTFYKDRILPWTTLQFMLMKRVWRGGGTGTRIRLDGRLLSWRARTSSLSSSSATSLVGVTSINDSLLIEPLNLRLCHQKACI